YANMSHTSNGDTDDDSDIDKQSDSSVEDTIMLGKIASLGFKIKHGFSYHGIALNLDCDLSAFNAINPCGYAGMQMLRLADFVTMNNDAKRDQQIGAALSYEQITQKFIDNVAKRHAGLIDLRPIASYK
ncbi:lipoyl protein ligase domain-containing protein, partial [Psychrobacter sp. 1U2]